MTAAKHTRRNSFRQLVTFVPDTYWDRTSRPIYALVYLLGFVVLYEIGTLIIHPEALTQSLAQPQTRVVSFIWVQNLLEYLGFSVRMTWILTPLMLILILLFLQITSKTRWKVYLADFLPMTMECILLAIPLIVLSLMLNRSAPAVPANAAWLPSLQGLEGSQELWMQIITGIGAGIYEELVFRLILIGLLMILLQDFLGFQKVPSITASVLISAVLFSVHHHIFFINGQFGAGEEFLVSKFVFRMLAGAYFALLYAFRGFGITAGTHACYDILAAVLNLLVFS
jgi:membrane protease YdiL (CAAX protease family)